MPTIFIFIYYTRNNVLKILFNRNIFALKKRDFEI